uniref:Cadherin-1 n=1 Tax=Paramormyrops kingsleyae TaxID=1676925 RepID=A0A3B3S359_9TELE
MGTYRVLALGLIFLLQAFTLGSCKAEEPCQPRISSKLFTFNVDRAHLEKGRRLGRVLYDDCSGRQRFLYNAADSRFKVESDGTVLIKRPVTLHEGHRSFFVHAWDSVGKKVTARVTVQLEPQTSHVVLGVENVPAEQFDGSESIPVLEFPWSSAGLKRRKREWVIPPITILEGGMGPFPKDVVRIRSSKDKELVMEYWITGPGANEPPKDIFTIDKTSGQLYVTQPLDREKCATYTLLAHAKAVGSSLTKEDPMEVIIKVGDQNDNKPVFTQHVYTGSVPEAVGADYEILSVTATDADDPETSNAALRYSIISQDPALPAKDMFAINPTTGQIRLNNGQLDKKKYPQYTLTVQVADMMGEGYSVTCTAVITVTDSNDNAPQFDQQNYEATVPENQKDFEVLRLPVTDVDDPETPAWFTKFKIIQGNDGNVFNVSTAPGGLDGVVTLIKELDFEKKNKYTLMVTVENEAPFAIPLPTATATVVVNVQDKNEAPVFNPREKHVSVEENLAVNEIVTQYTATDPDTRMKQTIEYRMVPDQLGWLAINKTTGYIAVKSKMDREESSLIDGKYKALVLAVDNGTPPTTGTGTLIVDLKDVNDNAPTIDQREIRICNKDPEPVLLSVSDKDGPQFGPPFRVELRDKSRNNWTAKMNESNTGIILTLKEQLPRDKYNVVLRIFDNNNLFQDNTLAAEVCDCTGKDATCDDKYVAGLELPGILGILAAILLLLLLVLLLLMFLRRRTRVKKEPLLQDDDIRDNIYYYDEEGGGEEDQDYDLSQIHRGLDNRPDVFRNDVAPTFLAAPQYRPRPANPEDIGNFIDDNLKAADTDPTAPPYDSLLVFDYEGGGSDAGSLSSLNSSSSGEDQDYNCLNEWGPRFKKLADMYGGGEED